MSEPLQLKGGPQNGSAPLAACMSYICCSALRTDSVSDVDAYAVAAEMPRSPGQTMRSRLAPSLSTVVPPLMTALLSQLGPVVCRPWVGAIVDSCTV